MRVVVDTGVFISAAIKAQTVPNIAVHRAAQPGVLLKSSVTEAELMEVISRPYLERLIAPAAQDRLVELLAKAELVSITERIMACRDPKDDKFLELAVNGNADLIVTGDADLIVLNPFSRYSNRHASNLCAGDIALTCLLFDAARHHSQADHRHENTNRR